MKQIMKTKILRKVLILAFLIVGLAAVELDSSSHVSATPPTCSEAFQNYSNADNAYYTARLSYINGAPNTCAEACSGIIPYADCVSNCQTTRATAFYSTQLDLFEAAEGTCAPEPLYYTCADANQAAYSCYALYGDTSFLTDQDEIAAVQAQYQACRIASKVDTCQ